MIPKKAITYSLRPSSSISSALELLKVWDFCFAVNFLLWEMRIRRILGLESTFLVIENPLTFEFLGYFPNFNLQINDGSATEC